jgi:hypothetical protein
MRELTARRVLYPLYYKQCKKHKQADVKRGKGVLAEPAPPSPS